MQQKKDRPNLMPLITECSDHHPPADGARAMAELGAVAVGANCEQEPSRMLPFLRSMREAAQASK